MVLTFIEAEGKDTAMIAVNAALPVPASSASIMGKTFLWLQTYVGCNLLVYLFSMPSTIHHVPPRAAYKRQEENPNNP